MEAVKLVLIFGVIVTLLHLRRPLSVAIAGGILAACIFYRFDFFYSLQIIGRSLTSWGTLSLLLIFYLIMFLQRMLEKRNALLRAREALDSLSGNMRVNVALAPMLVGLLPSAAVMTICGSIVNSYCKELLSAEERTLVASYFRHIPESVIPTFSSIIIGVELSGVPLPSFILGMLPMVAVLIGLGWYFLLRTIPTDTGRQRSARPARELAMLGKNLWPLIAIVSMVIVAHLPVYAAVGIVIIVNIFVDKFTVKELCSLILPSFEKRLLLNTALIMIFKDVIGAAGIIEVLPGMFTALPVPAFLIFFLIFFFGTIISGQQAMTAIAIPLAFATIPDGGMPLLVLLLSAGYIAMQISPTHLCLAIVTEYFHTDMGTLIWRTLPILVSFIPILLAYYILLRTLLA